MLAVVIPSIARRIRRDTCIVITENKAWYLTAESLAVFRFYVYSLGN